MQPTMFEIEKPHLGNPVAGVQGDLYIPVVGKCGIRHFDDEEYVLRERESSGIAIVTQSKKGYVGLRF